MIHNIWHVLDATNPQKDDSFVTEKRKEVHSRTGFRLYINHNKLL